MGNTVLFGKLGGTGRRGQGAREEGQEARRLESWQARRLESKIVSVLEKVGKLAGREAGKQENSRKGHKNPLSLDGQGHF